MNKLKRFIYNNALTIIIVINSLIAVTAGYFLGKYFF